MSSKPEDANNDEDGSVVKNKENISDETPHLLAPTDQTPLLTITDLPSNKIGRYLIIRKLGEGGMGRVYLAQHPITNKHVALKLLLERHNSNPASVKRFEREATIGQKLRSPHVVAIYDFAFEQKYSLHYIVMEFINGETLAGIIKKRYSNGMPVELAISAISAIAKGVRATHEFSVYHRDLKPENILIPLDPASDNRKPIYNYDHSKLTDYGLSKDGSDSKQLEDSIFPMGTPGYTSPEQCVQGISGGIKSDIFSLGATLYFMLTARLPVEGRTANEIMEATKKGLIIPIKSIRSDLPDKLAGIVSKCLAANPDDRFDSTQSLLEAISESANGLPPINADTIPLAQNRGQLNSDLVKAEALFSSCRKLKEILEQSENRIRQFFKSSYSTAIRGLDLETTRFLYRICLDNGHMGPARFCANMEFGAGIDCYKANNYYGAARHFSRAEGLYNAIHSFEIDAKNILLINAELNEKFSRLYSYKPVLKYQVSGALRQIEDLVRQIETILSNWIIATTNESYVGIFEGDSEVKILQDKCKSLISNLDNVLIKSSEFEVEIQKYTCYRSAEGGHDLFMEIMNTAEAAYGKINHLEFSQASSEFDLAIGKLHQFVDDCKKIASILYKTAVRFVESKMDLAAILPVLHECICYDSRHSEANQLYDDLSRRNQLNALLAEIKIKLGEAEIKWAMIKKGIGSEGLLCIIYEELQPLLAKANTLDRDNKTLISWRILVGNRVRALRWKAK